MKKARFKRFNFSLTESVSEDIDAISLLPRNFKCSRSDVLKASILSFKTMSKAEQIEALKEVCVNKNND
ncbi:hypothetical protein GLP30_04915 [Photobacterium phosphoreum]|uniref:Uncharacterized protein n=1 Tax=Photobacterium phosphoreum TaxID=659 RepID=A0AAW4ZPY1_PHOPO|nr:hypothetical protein [Photobacterium phosphoreum]MCD9490169.1 hypothetical protein [Photobacterium phosphoreum]MCF2189435.1 hypothetical protein [Photobacterium phosphoreum]MCF2301227.1 hypothetical protein [Photobacterium phosphoreum]